MNPVDALFPKARELRNKGLCPTCGKVVVKKYSCGVCGIVEIPVVSFKDESSRKEYKISGMCQRCQDIAFGA